PATKSSLIQFRFHALELSFYAIYNCDINHSTIILKQTKSMSYLFTSTKLRELRVSATAPCIALSPA
ncbi:MAG: hypothetical protein QX199_00100, partial [Methylococcaceae bacterium]